MAGWACVGVVVNAEPEYLTLRDACDRFFGGKIQPASLRAEAKRGRSDLAAPTERACTEIVQERLSVHGDDR